MAKPPPGRGLSGENYLFLRLCLFALSRLRYLCLLIFLRRFLTTEPIQVILICEIGVWRRSSSIGWVTPERKLRHIRMFLTVGSQRTLVIMYRCTQSSV